MKARPLLAMLPLIAVAFAQAPRPITFVGEFSNMRYTEEHAYGYSVQLWREGAACLDCFWRPKGWRATRPPDCSTT
jgi:hypothetical protein